MSQPDPRRRDLAAIHIAAKQLGLDDDAYRAMLQTVAGARSAADLDATGRRAVLNHLRRLIGRAAAHPAAARPRNYGTEERGPLLRKIEALLTDQKLPWTYAQAIARRLTKKDRLEFCSPGDLAKVIAALSYRQRRWRRKV